MPPSIVLVEPLIPQNTGSTARLTAATNTVLHLIEPLGFEISDKYLKRAGLDYWPFVRLHVHKDWAAFLHFTGCRREQLWFFTTKSERSYTSVDLGDEPYLVFGNESTGLSSSFHDEYGDRRVRIPMENPGVRSLNVSNAASIALYEARRQIEVRGATNSG